MERLARTVARVFPGGGGAWPWRAQTARVGGYGEVPIMPIFVGSQIDSAGQ